MISSAHLDLPRRHAYGGDGRAGGPVFLTMKKRDTAINSGECSELSNQEAIEKMDGLRNE